MISRESLKAIKPVFVSYHFCKFLLFQVMLSMTRIRDWIDSKKPGYIPVPPALLRYRVHGNLDKKSFLQTGEILANNIRDLCLVADRKITSFDKILDFGCGSGRVLRNFQDLPASCQLHGTDINLELVSWCKKYLSNIQWSTNEFDPPLPFPDNTFDLIYAISVFTHLDEKFQHTWLRELQRIAKPGAILILTVLGEPSIVNLPTSQQNEVHSHGFLYVTGITGKLKLDKLPDFYQVTYHTREYINREWSSYFDVVEYVERGINNHQDAVILRKT